MITQQICIALLSLLVQVICSGLQLSSMSMDCRPCSCQPDPDYGGTLANCSHKELRHVSLPAPGNITTLLLDYNPLYKLSISDFEGMANLRHLSVRSASLTTIEEAPEVIFTNLEYLDLSRNFYLGLPEIVQVMSWLRRGTLKTLLLDFIVTLRSVIVPLDGVYCSAFQHTTLKELHLDGNVFPYIGKNCLLSLPKTIEVISIRYTMLGGFDGANLTGLLKQTSLRSLDLTGFVTWNPGNGMDGPWYETFIPPVLFLMPSLEVFSCKGTLLKTDLGKITLFPIINNITTIDMSDNMVTSMTGPLKGLHNLEHFDVSKNEITSISKTVLTYSNKIKFVNLSNNYLGNCLGADTHGDILKQLHSLEVSDISINGITFLPKQILQASVNLRYLNISGNFLTNFNVDISHMRNLIELNLRNNKLTTLPKGFTDQLNLLPDVKVIMDDNPLSCSCDTLEFLEWMRERDNLQGIDNLTCTLTNGTIMKLQFLDHILSSLHESCKSDLVLIASSVSGAFALLMLVSGFMVYRHRWKLRYLYHAGRNRYQLVNNDEDIDQYQYDAFISYADSNRTFVKEKMLVELEDKSGLKVCIHSRDFLPGDIITENIINAIQNSRKTVILLSPEFLKSEWCIYEFHMARLDGINRKMNNLLVILLQEVAVDQLPKDLAMMMTRNSYLEYSTDIYGEAVFWDSLTEGIKTLKRMG